MTLPTLSRRHMLLSLAVLVAAGDVAHAASPPALMVHKDPDCGCCDGWVEHLRRAGFDVTVRETADLAPLKVRLGVPEALASCHTAELATELATEPGRYVIEGHVPARAIARLLAERPDARGLAVPGMPAGSPGMGGAPEIYDVILFGAPGATSYGRFRGDREV
ncbi:MAG: hypothetical protein GHHEDOFH_03008 [Pseudorhodoplanes sp.]|nr:hypothetical protein [Pseudorhodoplanes sp.]